jgi:hypothetical protein
VAPSVPITNPNDACVFFDLLTPLRAVRPPCHLGVCKQMAEVQLLALVRHRHNIIILRAVDDRDPRLRELGDAMSIGAYINPPSDFCSSVGILFGSSRKMPSRCVTLRHPPNFSFCGFLPRLDDKDRPDDRVLPESR